MSTDTATGRFTASGLLAETNRYQLAFAAVFLLALLTGPLWAGGFTYSLALASLWAMFAMGWDLLSGYTRYISFGHSLLSGTAAYTTALLVTQVDPSLSIAVTLPLSVLAALLAGWAFAIPSLRLRGPYFSLITLVGVLVAVQFVFIFGEYTGGELGLSIGAITYDTTWLYYMTLLPTLLVGAGLLAVVRSNIGLIFRAIGANEPAVEAAGLDTTKFKLLAFTLSAIPMGIGGALIAHFYGNVDPDTVLAVARNIEIIAIAVIGGFGTVVGALGGAYLFILLRDDLLPMFLDSHTRYVVLWTITLLIFFRYPDGIFKKLWELLGTLGGDRE